VLTRAGADVVASGLQLVWYLQHASSVFMSPKAFFARLPRPSSSNLRRPEVSTKHGGASFVLCVCITSLESQLSGVAWGSLHSVVKARPSIVAPWRRGSTLMSWTYDPWWALYWKCQTLWVGVETKLHLNLLSLFAARLTCDIAAQSVMVIPLTLIRSITTPGCAVILRTSLHGLGCYLL
jgi:hypothetical protein